MKKAPSEMNHTLTHHQSRLRKKRRNGITGALIGLVISFCIFGPYLFEPTDPPRYLDVNIVSYHYSSRSQYFTVVSKETGQSWHVGAVHAPIAPEYRGPAVVVARRGRWTGRDHFRFLENKPSGPGVSNFRITDATTAGELDHIRSTNVEIDGFSCESPVIFGKSHEHLAKNQSADEVVQGLRD